MNWRLPSTYDVEVSEQQFSEEALKGKYNVGYKVDDLGLSDELTSEDSQQYVLWTPLEENTPETRTNEDLTAYHLARARNADIMTRNGLDVPETALVRANIDDEYEALFLATPYIDHETFEQRPKFPGGDPRRNNPHRQDPFESQDMRDFEAAIDRAMEKINGEELVQAGKVINAGDGDIDNHNKNWGLVDGELMRLDIGEVPARGPVWNSMPYSGPEEFYVETGLRNKSNELLEQIGVDPDESIPEDLRELMEE